MARPVTGSWAFPAEGPRSLLNLPALLHEGSSAFGSGFGAGPGVHSPSSFFFQKLNRGRGNQMSGEDLQKLLDEWLHCRQGRSATKGRVRLLQTQRPCPVQAPGPGLQPPVVLLPPAGEDTAAPASQGHSVNSAGLVAMQTQSLLQVPRLPLPPLPLLWPLLPCSSKRGISQSPHPPVFRPPVEHEGPDFGGAA